MQTQSQSIGKKGKYASASQVIEIRKQRVQAVLYDPNRIKTRGDISIPEVKRFRSDLSVFSQITGSVFVPVILLTAGTASATLTATQEMTPIVTALVQRLTAIASPVTFSISPSLPVGLSFSDVDATLSGTPMQTLSPTTFTVTAEATSIYQTATFASVSFVLSVEDSTSDLSYTRSQFLSAAASSTTPTIETPPWGVLRPNVSELLSATVNQLFVAANLPAQNYNAVNFTGFFKAPETGSYTFGYSADDGIELYLDGSKIINSPGATTTHSGTSDPIALVANQYYAVNGLWTNGGGPGNLVFTAMNINGTDKLATYPIKTRFYQ